MRAVVQEVPEHWLEERTRKGWDRFDEVWEGVLHMVPPPSLWHQTLGTKLIIFLGPRLSAKGIETVYDSGLFGPGPVVSYRQPDIMFYEANRPGIATARGVEGPALAVVEIRSPNDETYDKFDFYARVGVAEIIVIEPDPRTVELYRLAGTRYLATSADDRGRLHAASINVRFSTISGPHLRVEHEAEACEI